MRCCVRLLSKRRRLLVILSLNALCLGALAFMTRGNCLTQKNNVHHRQYRRLNHSLENNIDFHKPGTLGEEMKQNYIGDGKPDHLNEFHTVKRTDDIDKDRVMVMAITREKRIKEAEQSADAPLMHVPPVPEYSDTDIVPFFSQAVMNIYQAIPDIVYTKKIVILTPICDVAHNLSDYMEALAGLSYPHGLILVYFGEDSSSDRTLGMAKLLADDLVNKHGFSAADAFHYNILGEVHGARGDVHPGTSQYARRSHLAKARNILLNKAMKTGQYDYVLWIDSDIKTLPSDLIEQLLYADTDVIVPSCLFHQNKFKKVFDKNSWRETPLSIQDEKDVPAEELIVEGYTHTLRIYLPDLKAEGRVVPLDGVGGCVLMVKASCHRKGLEFPQTVYNHRIETEGLAKMATNMGFKVMGLPWVETFHQ